MKTEAVPEYNIAHHTPNPNRRVCHRDHHGDDAHGKVHVDSSRQNTGQGLCIEGFPSEKDRQAGSGISHVASCLAGGEFRLDEHVEGDLTAVCRTMGPSVCHRT